MPLVAPLVSAAIAIGAIAGAAVTTQNWSHQRNEALYAEIDADIRKTLLQHDMKKAELAAAELKAPAMVSPNTTGTDMHDARKDEKARKAQISSLRKRASGARRERLVPPDFARLPISIMRSAFGTLR